MKKRIIDTPTPDIPAILKRRMPGEFRSRLGLIRINAIGLLILPTPDLYFYVDVTSRNANVVVSKVFDSYPQHITTLAIFGEAVAVYGAIRIIEEDDNQFWESTYEEDITYHRRSL